MTCPPKLSAEDQGLLDKFLADNCMFLGPDPEIMRDHTVQPRSKMEEEVLAKNLDPHQVHHVRGLINAALSEAFTMQPDGRRAPTSR